MRVQSGHLSISITAVLVCLCTTAIAAPPTHTISGIVQTAAGTGIDGVSVTGDNGATSAVTAADGSYSVAIPNNWSGTIYAHKSGWIMTPSSKAYSGVKSDIADENYSAWQPIISGTVTKRDGSPLEGVTITADNNGGTTVTNANGYYELSVRYEWFGNLSASLAGFTFTSKAIWYLTTDAPNVNFTGFQPKISGYVRNAAGTGLSGATVTSTNGGGTATTDANGYYEILVPNNWSGTLSATLAGYSFTAKNYSVVVSDKVNQNFTGFQPAIIGSTGVAGATVTASGVGSVVSTPAYSISVPYGWSGTLSAELNGYYFSDSPKTYTIITANLTNQNFTPYQPTISGFIRKEDGTGGNGITVSASNGGGVTTTNTSGYYQLIVPYNWSGQISANNPKWQIVPDNYSYTNVISDVTEQNFTGIYDPVIIVKADGTGYVPTIQAAIDIAEDGDIVQVEDGTYTGDGNRDIDFLGKAITVRGNVADPNLVVIDSQGTETERRRGIKFVSGEGANSILEGFTIINGCGTDERFYIGNNMHHVYPKAGGGIYCYNSSPTVSDCIVRYHLGKGIFCYGGNPTIENCTLSHNETGLCTFTSSPLLQNCTIKGNSPYGGINCDSGSPIIQDCTIAGNSSAGSGGGIYCFYSSPVIQNCAITDNTATNSGGGIYLKQTRTTLIDCIISSNSSNEGGGICNYIGDPVIQNCDIKNNTATNSGGGIWLGTLDSPSIVHDKVTFQNCNIKNNTSMNSGGGIFLMHYTTAIVHNCTIANNSGTGIHRGGKDSGAVIENCTIINNNPYGIASLDYGRVQNSLIWGNSLGQIGISVFTVTYSNIQGGYTGTGNISLNPLFETDGFHLTLDSPCINAGAPDYISSSDEIDIDGDPRVIGGRIDMGADEFSTDEPFIVMPLSTLNFTALEARDNPSSRNMTFFNLGAQDFYWTASSNVSWLNVTPTNGSINYEESASISVAPEIDGLPAGQYFGQITISDSNAIISPKIIDVNLTITGPSLDISQTNYSFTASKETLKPEPQILTISNSGGGTLLWNITPDCNWMRIEPASGAITTGSADVMLDIYQNNIEYGMHSCQLTVESLNGANNPRIVTVNLDVLEPEIGLNQNSVNFISEGIADLPASQMLTISNTGHDTLDWTITGMDVCDWLTVGPKAGQTMNGIPGEVTLSVNPAIAGYGSQTCQLTVIDPNASNSPQVVTVTLNVLRPAIEALPASVSFECNADDPNTYKRSISVSNSGYDALNWEISEDCDWFSAAPAAGQCTTETSEVMLTANTEGLGIGTYTCNLTITDDNASNSPRTVPVSLHVYRSGERHVPMEYAAIQAAIDAAVDGDHVIVHPGRYTPSYDNKIFYKGKAITVRSIDPADPNIVASTILDNYRISFDKGEGRNSVFDGLTINGSVNCFSSSPVIKNCSFFPAMAYGDSSGLIYVYKGNPYIQNCDFVGMRSLRQGNPGIIIFGNRYIAGDTIIENCLFSLKCGDPYMMPSVQIVQGHAEIINTTIAYCQVNTDSPYPYMITGTALFIRESDVSVKNSIVWGNRGSDDFQIAVLNYNSVFGHQYNSRVNITYSDIEGGQDKILMFPGYGAFDAYRQSGILPDPNLIDPATLVWGPGNIDADPLFAREPNDGGDGWFPISGVTTDYSPVYNNDYGDLHLKSQTGRFVWDGFANADFNLDKQVNLIDFAEMAQNWGVAGTTYLLIPCNLYYDGKIDLNDVACSVKIICSRGFLVRGLPMMSPALALMPATQRTSAGKMNSGRTAAASIWALTEARPRQACRPMPLTMSPTGRSGPMTG